MKKRFFISVILLSFVIIVVFAQQSCGDYPCVLVEPNPPYCAQHLTEPKLMCACTACAMVMRYWALNGLIKEKNCIGYQTEFKTEFGSSDGSAHSSQFDPALKKIGKTNLIDPYKDAEVETMPRLDPIKSYEIIIEYLKYSNKNEEKSPWDRPGVLLYKTKKGAHAVCVWGYYKGPLSMPKDPNAPIPPEPTGSNIPKKMRWGIVYRIHDGQTHEKYKIYKQNQKGKYNSDGDMYFVWFKKKECSL